MLNSADKNNNSSSCLEERHFLADPRPVPGLDLPTWEVDVLREGVEQPILTLLIDAKVLPARKKKKKIQWKLPDSIETNPKFGEQDKRRILELFREKKKELKKLKNKQRAYRRASSMEAMNPGDGGVDSGSENGIGNKPNPANDESPSPKNLPPEKGRRTHNSKVNTDDRDDSSLSPPGFGKLTIAEPGNESASSVPPAPHPGFHSSSPLKPAPPGLPSKHRQQSNGQLNSNHQNGFSPSNASASQAFRNRGLPQNGQHTSQYSQQSPQTSPPPGLMNGYHSPKLKVPQLPRAVGPCFVLPPEAPPGASMGKFVTNSYYLLLRNGLIEELDTYYYKSSGNGYESGGGGEFVYKAVAVGGAHAVCATPQDRLVQHQTFAGCEMRIKGVQQQPTVGKGILVLITGVSIRTTVPPPGSNGQAQQQQLPFCHTLILKPVLTTTMADMGENPAASASSIPTIGYQILNDNLIILTGDE